MHKSDREIICSTIADNIQYHGSMIPNEYSISQKIAWELGFSDYIANIIRNVFLKHQTSGNPMEDSQKITEEIIKAIWIQ